MREKTWRRVFLVTGTKVELIRCRGRSYLKLGASGVAVEDEAEVKAALEWARHYDQYHCMSHHVAEDDNISSTKMVSLIACIYFKFYIAALVLLVLYLYLKPLSHANECRECPIVKAMVSKMRPFDKVLFTLKIDVLWRLLRRDEILIPEVPWTVEWELRASFEPWQRLIDRLHTSATD